MNTAAVLQIILNAQTAQANAALLKTEGQLKRTTATANATSTSLGTRLGGAAKTAAKYVGTGAAVGLGYGLIKGVQAGISFEKQMDSVAAVANATGKEFKQLENQALRLGQSTAYSASEVATAQSALVKGGLRVKDVLGGALPAALKLAAAGEMELGAAAETTVNSMKLFGLAGRDATKIADMLATAANTTTADVEDFAMALKQGGSVAKQAGLSMNDTVTVLEALAEAGIKNSDAGTSMKAAFLQLLAPTEKQRALMEQLNLSVIDNNGNLKSAAGISAELQEALGGMTNAQQAANLKVLAGTDGFRTLAALYDAGPEKLKKLAKANLEQGTAQEIAKKKMDNTAGSLEQLSGALETLSIKMFKSAQSPFRDFIDGATKAVKQFTDIVTDKKLTSDEKISKVMEMVSGAVEDALPKIAKAGAQIGSTLAKAIVNSFINGDILTRLFIGGMVIKAMGGFEAIKTMGKTSGKVFGRGWVAGVILALPLILPEAYKIGKQIGQQLRKGIGDLAGWIKDELAGDTIKDISDKIANAPLAWAKKWSEAGFSFGTIVDQLTDAGVAADKAARITDKAMHSVQDGYGKSGDAARKYAERAKDGLDKSGDAADKNAGKRIPKSLSTANKSMSESERATDSLRSKASTNFGKVGDASAKQSGRVASNNASMVNAVGKGQEILRDNTNKALKAYGVKEINFTAKTVAGGIGKAADILGLQRGGHINMGTPTGDSVPALLERDEYVLNRNAVKAIGKDKLDAINFGAAKRFQTGGAVGDTGGLQAGILRLASILSNKFGMTVTSGVRPGGTSLHSTGTAADFAGGNFPAAAKYVNSIGGQLTEGIYNPASFGGPAVSWDSGSQVPSSFWGSTTWGDHMDHIHAAVGNSASLKGVSKQVKRVILEGAKGKLRAMGQGALDKIRKGAQSYVDSKMPSVGTESMGGHYSGPLDKNFGAGNSTQIPFEAAAMLAEKAGLPGVTYAQIAIGESNLTPGAVSPDGGYGLWQMTPRAQSAATVNAWENVGTYFNPWNNAQQAKILAGSGTGVSNYYGIGAVTDWNKHYTGPMKFQKGGLVQYLSGGGQPGLNINPPSGMGLQVTGPASFPGWSQANSAASLAAALTAKLNEIAGLDETLDLERSLADRDGLFTASEIQSQIALNAKLLPALNAARDIAKLGATTVLGGLGVAKGPNRAALLDMAPGFSDTVVDMQGVTGKGGRIFDTFMEIARLQSTTPDVPGGRGTILDAIESQIALAGLTPDLADDIVGYKALVSYWEQALSGLQASGAPFTEIGSAASALKSARDTLNDLLGGSGSTSGIESDLNALKLEQAMATIRRLNVGIAQNSVFMGGFADGGVALVGERGPELIHTPSGTRVHSAEDTRQMLSPEVHINIAPGMEWLRQFIQVEVGSSLDKKARSRSYAGAGRL